MILSYLRTLFLYLVLIFAVRLMGKRQIGEMEPAEFVVTMLVANLAAIPMQDGAIPLYSGLVPILTVLGLELVLSGAILRSVRLRQLLCGKPVILIDNGKILQDNLRNARVTLDELTGHLRERTCWISRRCSLPFWRPTAICPCSPTLRKSPHRPRTRGCRRESSTCR